MAEKRNEGTHTPGPWIVGTPADSQGRLVYTPIITHPKVRVACAGVYGHLPTGETAGKKYVDKYGDERHKPYISEAEARANARLIAAAPELYEALNGLVGMCALLLCNDLPQKVRFALESNPRVVAAKEALAKAEKQHG